MAEYDLGALSPYEFEKLIRDLFQAEMGILLESFKPGKDSGIDLRNCLFENQTIIQCKHYFNSPYSVLLNNLKKEQEKVKDLKPSRYIVVTSCGLTPSNKSEIQKLFEPYSQSDGDVFGREDIFNLLIRHEDVVKKNYKLWFTSETVLRRILHNRHFIQTEIDLENFKQILPKMVLNAAYFKVEAVLENKNVCLISGQPGIGKSTLMKLFVLKYADAGYEPVKISQDIKEAYDLFNKDRRQIFYYDDFLGQLFLKQGLEKNEDKELLSFITKITKMPNKKLILTTREYIFNQAESQSEIISLLKQYESIISMSDFSLFEKAQILYNHLWHSNIGFKNIHEILEEKNYMKIVQHRNFNPRIIEWMTLEENINSDNYLKTFLNSLNHPDLIWEHAFANQIGDSSKILLVALASFPSQCEHNTLFNAYKKIYQSVNKNSNDLTCFSMYRNSLKELQGTFILSYSYSSNYTLFRFSNPSIRDYIHSILLKNKLLLENLCENIIYFDQIENIWNILEKSGNITNFSDYLDLNKYLNLIKNFMTIEFSKSVASEEYKKIFLHLIRVTQKVKKKEYIQAMNEALSKLQERIRQEKKIYSSFYDIFIEVKKEPTLLSMNWADFCEDLKLGLLAREPWYIDQFIEIINYIEKIGIQISNDEYDNIKDRFVQIIDRQIEIVFEKDSEIEISIYNPEEDCYDLSGTGINDLEKLKENLVKISIFFDLNISSTLYDIRRKIDAYYDDWEPDEDEASYIHLKESQEAEVVEIDTLFISLEEK